MFGFLEKLQKGLGKTSANLSAGLQTLLRNGQLDSTTLEELEELLISADLGVETSLALVAELREHNFGAGVTEQNIKEFLAEKIEERLKPVELPENEFFQQTSTHKPFVLMVVGVNGAGKTTTIGKLVKMFAQNGKKVAVVAGDTFRAGAVAQLAQWAERAGGKLFQAEKEGADPAGLVFQAMEKAQAENIDILVADTAGRLQNRTDLMAQLEKMIRVAKKQNPEAPHATWLVLDATVGQNALSQVETFQKTCGVTGLVVTKLDGSAKAGMVVALAEKFKLPIHYVGVGEGMADLQPFQAKAFARSLVGLPAAN